MSEERELVAMAFCWTVVMLAIIAVVVYLGAEQEARVFNRCRGTDFTAWDAMFVQLMIQDCQ